MKDTYIINKDAINADDGTSIIINAVYKVDALSTVSLVFHELQTLLSTKRGATESFRNFESRFNANLCRYNSLGSSISMSEPMAALYLLANANVDASQRVSILASAASNLPTPTESTNSTANTSVSMTTDTLVSQVSYEGIASVLRQCDQPRDNRSNLQNPLLSNLAHHQRFNKYKHRNKQHFQLQSIVDKKRNNPCHRCGMYGHWANEHLLDGSLKPGTLSLAEPIKSDKSENANDETSDANGQKIDDPNATNSGTKSITFNDSTLCDETLDHSKSHSPSMHIGPLVDSGAPYSAIGFSELCLLSHHILPHWQAELLPIPDSLDGRTIWQYGSGTHSSPQRRILGSVFLNIRSDDGDDISIRHLVLDGSSQWVIGRNVLRHCNIMQLHDYALIIPGHNNNTLRFPLTLHDHHDYLSISFFHRCRKHCSHHLL